MDSAAWMLMKSYFPATYYFYCGMLMLCYAGTVKQWAQWKTISWLAALVVIATMLLPVLNAWLPFRLLSPEGVHFWQNVITAESLLMMAYCSIAMWQVGRWILEGRDDNYSNPDDFPIDYARRIWLMPLALTPILWPAYLLDSPAIMALEHILLAIFNILLLIIVMPIWRRTHIISSAAAEEVEVPHLIAQHDATVDEQIAQTALEIQAYVEDQRAYLDSHLKVDDVVAHSQRGRTYVSLTFQRRFGSFANYVNSLRLAHYEHYVAEHPDETKEAAAQASGFSSYNAYYRAKHKLERPE